MFIIRPHALVKYVGDQLIKESIHSNLAITNALLKLISDSQQEWLVKSEPIETPKSAPKGMAGLMIPTVDIIEVSLYAPEHESHSFDLEAFEMVVFMDHFPQDINPEDLSYGHTIGGKKSLQRLLMFLEADLVEKALELK